MLMDGQRMRKRNLKRQILNYIFPPRCPVCDKILDAGEAIHAKCYNKLYFVKEPCCVKCGAPVESKEQEYCFDCDRKQKSKTPDAYKQGRGVFVYRGAIKDSMYRFKYSNKREYADYYAKEAMASYSEWIKMTGVQAIVPVPMYGSKKRLRGYNQAEVFAKALSKECGLPLVRNGVKRIKDTVPLKTLSPEERKNNLKNAFQVTSNIVQYDYILLVDDIYTTGSTADAVTRELLRMGAQEVYLLCICVGQGF